jgi:hypothetical protein
MSNDQIMSPIKRDTFGEEVNLKAPQPSRRAKPGSPPACHAALAGVP